jgi:adenylate cyclase
MRRRPVLFRLRPTLLMTIVGLVLLTALTIGGGAALLTLSVTRTLIDQARTDAVTAARGETRQLFNEPPRIVRELAAAAHRGALQIGDRDRLVAILAEVLRVAPRLAVIGYGNAEGGWYVGAERQPDGEIVEYTVDPNVDGGVPIAITVAADGTRSAPKISDMKPYVATTRPWYEKGIAEPGPVWSSFYRFSTGTTGISCMSRFTAPGASAPTGVFHVDLQLAGVEEFLGSLTVGKRGVVFLVDNEGRRVVDPAGRDIARAAAALEAAAPRRDTATLANPVRLLLGERLYEVVFEPVPTDGDISLKIAVVVDLRDISGGAYIHAAMAAGVALITVLLAILCARRLSSRIANPIVAIATDLGRVGAFSISREPAPQSFVREVSELGLSVDRMKASLRSFAHYVPTDLVRTLLAHGREAELGGELRRLTIHFSDVADFTAISEGMEPTRLVEAMGRYFELMTGALTRYGGTVDKFMGDGIMAFFNAPEELPDHPRQACLAALEAQRLLAEMARATPLGEPVFRARIGLGLGEVLVGNIGTPERFAYTLLGDEVNLASRLEGLNKLYGTAIIASDAVMEEAGEGFEWRRLDRVVVKGRVQGTLVCELLGLKGEVPGSVLAARDVYERALDAYFNSDFENAGQLFDEAAQLRLGDRGATMMRERAHILADDPPLRWDGVHVMEEK